MIINYIAVFLSLKMLALLDVSLCGQSADWCRLTLLLCVSSGSFISPSVL